MRFMHEDCGRMLGGGWGGGSGFILPFPHESRHHLYWGGQPPLSVDSPRMFKESSRTTFVPSSKKTSRAAIFPFRFSSAVPRSCKPFSICLCLVLFVFLPPLFLSIHPAVRVKVRYSHSSGFLYLLHLQQIFYFYSLIFSFQSISPWPGEIDGAFTWSGKE